MGTRNVGSDPRTAPPFNPNTTLPGWQPSRREVPRGWWLMFVGALLITTYAVGYVVLGDRLYPPNLADSFHARPWGIYAHAFSAMFALGIGAFQFRGGLRARRPRLHRLLGRIYVPAAVLTGSTGIYMAVYSHGGMITHLGFGLLGAGVIVTTTTAFARIRARDIPSHRQWMIRSYALIFAAVTLRVLLPLLVIAYEGDFEPAYRWVAWLSWVPNALWAEWYVRRTRGSFADSAVVARDSAATVRA